MSKLALAVVLTLASAAAAAAPETTSRAHIPGATFATILPPAPDVKNATVRAFDMDRTPVTNAEFARFVGNQAQWRRDRVPRAFADASYLKQWPSAAAPVAGSENQPVTQISWFAANAYCEAQGARLPTWHEWELVGAAGADMADARANPEWRQVILDWYARPAGAALPDVGRGEPNYYGVRDVHGLVWEWILDLGSMMDPDKRFCGSGALTLEQKDNYAMLMRIATLSSMQASYTSSSMGFRCVTDAGPTP